MDEEFCGNCIYFKKKSGDGEKGLCRRYPPQMFGVYKPRETRVFSKSAQPEVKESDIACGEFIAKAVHTGD